MKTLLAIILSLSMAFAQVPPKETKVVKRIVIKHIDPQLLALLLSQKVRFGDGSEITKK